LTPFSTWPGRPATAWGIGMILKQLGEIEVLRLPKHIQLVRCGRVNRPRERSSIRSSQRSAGRWPRERTRIRGPAGGFARTMARSHPASRRIGRAIALGSTSGRPELFSSGVVLPRSVRR
jgi:hypothetical protein